MEQRLLKGIGYEPKSTNVDKLIDNINLVIDKHASSLIDEIVVYLRETVIDNPTIRPSIKKETLETEIGWLTDAVRYSPDRINDLLKKLSESHSDVPKEGLYDLDRRIVSDLRAIFLRHKYVHKIKTSYYDEMIRMTKALRREVVYESKESKDSTGSTDMTTVKTTVKPYFDEVVWYFLDHLLHDYMWEREEALNNLGCCSRSSMNTQLYIDMNYIIGKIIANHNDIRQMIYDYVDFDTPMTPLKDMRWKIRDAVFPVKDHVSYMLQPTTDKPCDHCGKAALFDLPPIIDRSLDEPTCYPRRCLECGHEER
jgi:hypothetical protein